MHVPNLRGTRSDRLIHFNPLARGQHPPNTMAWNCPDTSRARFVSVDPSGNIGDKMLDADSFKIEKVGNCILIDNSHWMGYLPYNSWYSIVHNTKTNERMRAIAIASDDPDDRHSIQTMHVLDSVETDWAAIKILYKSYNRTPYLKTKLTPTFPTARGASLTDDEKNVFGADGFTYSTKLEEFCAQQASQTPETAAHAVALLSIVDGFTYSTKLEDLCAQQARQTPETANHAVAPLSIY